MNKKIKIIAAGLLMLMLGFTAGCGSIKNSEHNSEKLNIMTTLFPQYDFARIVGGDHVEVTLLLTPGVESHLYDPTPKDMVAISESDLFIYTGENMEAWAHTIVESLEDSPVTVVDISQNVPLLSEEELEGDKHEEEAHHDHDHEFDPHIWLDLGNAQIMVQHMADALSEADPEHQGEYQANAAAYIEELKALDGAFSKTVEEGERSDLVFAGRFAYGYFIHRYGLDYESVYPGCSAETEPSVGKMAEIIDYIGAHGVKYILYEELTTPTIANAIAESAGVSTALFSTCHNLTKDEYEAGVTFMDLMQQNLEVLKMALNG